MISRELFYHRHLSAAVTGVQRRPQSESVGGDASSSADEQELEEEMKGRKEAKHKEEQKLKEEEENRKLKIEMELRQKEEAERLRQVEICRLLAKQLQDQFDKAAEDKKNYRERWEQERQDLEMALRLAKEANGHLKGSPPQLGGSEKVRMQLASHENQKYDLSNWKYSEIRHTINTSCNIELLEACRHEFHCRLKAYHAWKAGKPKHTTMGETEHAPNSIMETAKIPRLPQKSDIPTAQHQYFRVPFVRPTDEENPDENKGWWYAHYDDEQERLRKFEEEMKGRKEAKHKEEPKLKEEEENRKLWEQERQDHEMILRLAEETNDNVEDSSPPLRRSEKVRMQLASHENQKYDLSNWKYSDLRDTINTSELLEACQHEFHRRLKVYHAWKAGKQKHTTMGETEHAPNSIMEAGTSKVPKLPQKSDIPTAQHRFFRIPFVQPTDKENPQKKGWWYVHFDGQFVARQMELHPDKPPVQLTAGIHDTQICELSLDATGLTRKQGAEILESEFVNAWEFHGGGKYLSPSDHRK